MAQFDKTLSNNSQYRLELEVNYNPYSIPNNTTPVPWVLRVRKLSGSGYWASGTFNWSVNIGGVTSSGSISSYDFRNYTVLNLGSGTATITHDADGKKKINVSGSFTGASTLGNATASGEMDLPTIPRASSFTLGGSTQTGSAISVAISRASTSFTHRVRWRVGSGSWTTVTSNATTSASFTVPHSTFPNATSGTITVGVQTYSGSTTIGSEQTGTRTLTVPASIKPSLTGITHSEYVTLVKNEIGQYVQHKSRLNLAITGASAGSGASITAYRINVENQTINAISGTSTVITTSGNLNITATVTDSRGRVSDTRTVTVSVLPYAPPNVTAYSAFRSDSSGSSDFFNTFATVRFKTSVSSLNSKNTATYQIRSKELPSGAWGVKTSTTAVGLSENVTKTYSGYQRTLYYQFEIVISDKLSVVTIANDSLMVPTAGVPFLVGHGGIASSFGKIATHGTIYDLEIGEKGLRLDGPIVGKEGREVSSDSLFIPDKRNDNQPPSWYYSNYPHRAVTEFKFASVVGLSDEFGHFVALETIVPWYDGSGGEVKQIAWGNNNEAFYRTGLGVSSWRAWSRLSTTNKGAFAVDGVTSSVFTHSSASPVAIPHFGTQTINVKSDNATILIQGSAVLSTNLRTSTMKIWFDGASTSANAITNSTSPVNLTIQHVITGVPRGNHTVALRVHAQDSNTTLTMPSWTSANLSAIEL